MLSDSELTVKTEMTLDGEHGPGGWWLMVRWKAEEERRGAKARLDDWSGQMQQFERAQQPFCYTTSNSPSFSFFTTTRPHLPLAARRP